MPVPGWRRPVYQSWAAAFAPTVIPSESSITRDRSGRRGLMRLPPAAERARAGMERVPVHRTSCTLRYLPTMRFASTQFQHKSRAVTSPLSGSTGSQGGPRPARAMALISRSCCSNRSGAALTAVLDLDAFRATPLTREPFDFLMVRDFVRPEARAAIGRDFPRVPRGGSFPVEVLDYGPAFAALVEALNGAEMRRAFEEKFEIDIDGRQTMITVR